MKIKTLVILMMTLLLAFSFNFDIANANSFKEVKMVNSSSTVYEKSDTNSKVLGTVEKGTVVTLISKEQNAFSRITYLNSESKIIDGFISDSVLEDAQYTIKIASSKSGLVVKEMPALKAKTVATLQNKMVVKDFGSVGDGWSFVQYGNVIGYAATNFMSTSKPTTKYVVSNLVVRNIASPSGANVGELSKNEAVSVHSTIAGWSYISTLSYEGYVVDSYLSTKSPNATTNSKPSSSSNSNSSSSSSNSGKSYYKNCTELRKDYPNGVGVGHPAYDSKHDRDKDGWACER